MTRFNNHLLRLYEEISIDENEERHIPYMNMCEEFTEWLMNEMNSVDSSFFSFLKSTDYCGIHPNRARIMKPNEFDVLIVLKIPLKFVLKTSPKLPGFVIITNREWKRRSNFYVREAYEKFFEFNKMRRHGVHRWLQIIIDTVLSERMSNTWFKVTEYTRELVAHRILVTDSQAPARSIIINFVPIISLNKAAVGPLIKRKGKRLTRSIYIDDFGAIPKAYSWCNDKKLNPYTFELVNITAEQFTIWEKNDLKIVYYLMKLLRETSVLPRLKSSFLTSIFLEEGNARYNYFANVTVATIFINILKSLTFCFKNKCIPYYWSPTVNLLSVLTEAEIKIYCDSLLRVKRGLIQLLHPSVQYETVAMYFDLSGT